MAATTIALLAFVAVAAVAEEACVEESRGLRVGIRHDQVHILPAGQHRYEIELPSPCVFHTSGVKVRVCDPYGQNVPPQLSLPSLHHASVYRYISDAPAPLTATFYCLLSETAKVAGETKEAYETKEAN